MNAEQEITVQRLKEAELDTKRFLKVGDGTLHKTRKHPEGEYLDKAAFEKGFENHLYGPEDLDSFPRWGICGKGGLVFVEADKVAMATALREILPPTLEVKSPRRGLPHFYLKIEGGEVENKVLHLPGEEEGAGEIRARAPTR